MKEPDNNDRRNLHLDMQIDRIEKKQTESKPRIISFELKKEKLS